MKSHVWVGPKGEDWMIPTAESDNCHKCGSTPDDHPLRPTEWALQEAREIVYRISGPGMPYHTRVRREKELAVRLIGIVAAHREDGAVR